MTCQEDATFVGPVSLFCGIETANWKDADFTNVAQFAKQHSISSLLIKVSEVGSGAGDLWYGGVDGIDHIKLLIEAQGVKFIPYTFPVGPYIDLVANIQTAVNIAVQLLQRYGVVCLDIEGGPWVGSAGVTAGQALGNALKNIPGKLWLSCPANPVTSGQQGAFQALSPAVNVWMPMTYSDNLTGVYKEQIEKINPNACIQPTLDLSQEFGANDVLANVKEIKADGCSAISLWYEGFAKQDTGLLDAVVLVFGSNVGTQPPPQSQGGVSLKLDSNGCVMTVPKSFQLETGESPDLCGPWSVTAVAHSVPPGQTPHTSNEDIDVYTDNMVDKLFGPGGFDHIKFLGVLPDDMLKIMNYVRDDTGLIHYQVVPATLDNLYKALDAGYPVLFSCNEAGITAWYKDTQQWIHAYPWQLSAGHVLPAIGYEKGTKNIISPDQLNNSYQKYWPVIYKASDIGKSLSWMAIIQVVGPDKNKPYLAPIPSGNPASWPAGFNAQLFTGGITTSTPPSTPDNKAKAFAAEWGPNPNSGIAKAAYATYWTSNFAGGQVTGEFQLVGKDGKTYTAQRVHMGIWLWDGSAHYYAYKAG